MYKASYTIILLLLCIYCDNPQISEIPGCTIKTACNFDESANLDDGSCEFAEENYDCAGNCTAGEDCAGVCAGFAEFDACGICGNGCYLQDCATYSNGFFDCYGDCIAEIDCSGVCGGGDISCLDCCGVPNGDGSTCDGECGPCNDNIDEGKCNCDGSKEDCAGVCGGLWGEDMCGNCGFLEEVFDGIPFAQNRCYDCADEKYDNAVVNAVVDCAGVCEGDAEVDKCGVCDGGDLYLEYELVWQNEFDGNELDLDKWNVEEWTVDEFNQEKQAYTDEIDNIYLEDGNLHIRALRESYDPEEDGEVDALYTSGRITTKYKGDWQYAKVEVRAQLPLGRGTWPAIWMQPTEDTYGGWPGSGEIDIMEHVGYDQGKIHSSIHNALFYKELDPNHSDNASMLQHQTEFTNVDNVDGWNLYAMIWTKEEITYYVGDETAQSCPDDCVEIMVYRALDPKTWWDNLENNLEPDSELWPFDQKFYLILNLAIGGEWGGRQGIDVSIFPVQMKVDYVRVYQYPCD